ncbi:MAG: DNA polymerase III subunit delta [Patescibacteria group bacterium]
MIIFLYGPDTYRAHERLHFYREGFKKKYDPKGLNVSYLDGEKLSVEEFRKNVSQVGFLAEKRFTAIENVITKNKGKKVQEAIVEYLDTDWSNDNVVVFLEASIEEAGRKRKAGGMASQPLYQRLSQEKVEEFPLLTGAQLNRWIGEEVKRRGGTIAQPAVTELAALVGSDLWNMSTELDKLVGYRGKREISVQDAQLLVKAKFDENIFHLTDALAAKNAKLSFKLLHDQLNLGSHELYILTMLIRQFRILLKVKEIIGQEPNYYTVASRLRLHPFVAQKAVRDAGKFAFSELKAAYAQLLSIDVKIKTSQIDPRLMFDLFITRICAEQAAT